VSQESNGAEVQDLREVERIARKLVNYVDHHRQGWRAAGSPLHPFAPKTVEAVEGFKKVLARLDDGRRRRRETPLEK
jgi:hypothetical protein